MKKAVGCKSTAFFPLMEREKMFILMTISKMESMEILEQLELDNLNKKERKNLKLGKQASHDLYYYKPLLFFVNVYNCS